MAGSTPPQCPHCSARPGTRTRSQSALQVEWSPSALAQHLRDQHYDFYFHAGRSRSARPRGVNVPEGIECCRFCWIPFVGGTGISAHENACLHSSHRRGSASNPVDLPPPQGAVWVRSLGVCGVVTPCKSSFVPSRLTAAAWHPVQSGRDRQHCQIAGTP